MTTLEEVKATSSEPVARVIGALFIAFKSGQVDGAHHKAWCIDQMVRVLAGDDYEAFVKDHNAGDDGPDSYTWDVGIAP